MSAPEDLSLEDEDFEEPLPDIITAPIEPPLTDSDLMEEQEYAQALEFLCAAAKEDFPSWLNVMWPQIEGTTYIISRFHQYLAELVQDVVAGNRSPNQSVSVPPQHGKSRMLSVRAAAWILGHSPGKHIALTGFSFSLLADFLREIKDIVASPMYQMVFPGVVPVEGYNRQGSVMFSNGSSIQVTSAGSKLTGRRVDWLIVDDPHAGRFEAESVGNRKKVEQWFYGDCMSRLSPSAKVFLIGTRWHPEDLHGIVTGAQKQQELIDGGFAEQTFEVTNLKAIAEMGDPIGREVGEPLFPEQRPLKFLQALKIKMPGYEWDSQYNGTPRSSTGDVVDVKKIKLIDMADVPTDIEWYRGWDPAITDSSAADFTAGALCACRMSPDGEPMEFYLIDMKREQAAWAKMRFMVIETSKNDMMRGAPIGRVGIEGVGGFKAVFEDVKRELMGRLHVEPRNFQGGKLLRAQPWLNLVEAGRFYMVRAPWNKEFILELEKFPLGNHDDQCLTVKTLISTSEGLKCIGDVCENELVLTRKGMRRVLWSGKTGRAPVISRYGIEGTVSHPVWTENRSWVPLGSLRDSDLLVVDANQLDSKVAGIIDTQTQNKRRSGDTSMLMTLIGKAHAHCTAMFGKVQTVAPSLSVGKSITGLESMIIDLKVSKSSPLKSMVGSIEKTQTQMPSTARLGGVIRSESIKRKSSPKHKSVESDPIRSILESSTQSSPAKAAVPPSSTLQTGSTTSASLVSNENGMPANTNQDQSVSVCAWSATPRLLQIRAGLLATALERAGVVPQCSDSKCDVYNLTVEGEHEFFANGVLVHNCDAVSISREGLVDVPKILFA